VISLFIGLSLVNLLCLSTAAALGYARMFRGGQFAEYHQLAGALSAITCCAVHCIVFTYFIATAKWIQHAIEVKQLDPKLASSTKSFKAQAFPAALLAMFVVFMTAVVGVITLSYGIRPIWHHGLAVLSILVNMGVCVIEYRAISSNAKLIDGILDQINAKRPLTLGH
jgi:hypothetical protein